jgi:uncharacterized integral membrane protein (TIGR00698 family)
MPGLSVAAVVAAAALFVASTYGGPVMLLALLLGLALNFLSRSGPSAPGIHFAAKHVLRVGVVLLGARVGLTDIASLGVPTGTLVIAGVILTTFSGIALARLVGRRRRFGTLIGGATAICGASAALALASVLLRRANSEQETVFAVVSVTTLSTLAMIIYPALFHVLGFGEREMGILIGATIHDVAQVVGAGYAVSEPAGDIATVVKLFRVMLLVPVVLVVSFIFARERGDAEKGQLPIPLFIIAFIALVLINSLGLLSDDIRSVISALSRGCLVTAIAAIGLSTSLEEIARVGLPPVFVAVGSTVVLLIFSMLVVTWL